MHQSILGIHHITALASDPQRNLDFYAGVLGLRFVKRTVNFDAPDVYHFYYGDAIGRPGTVLTFFPFPDAAGGKRGMGETSAVAFRIPQGSLEYWMNRLATEAVHFQGPTMRFDEEFIALEDPDGMTVELIAQPGAERIRPWDNGDVEVQHAIRGFHGCTFSLANAVPSSAFLTDVLGFKRSDVEGNRHRFLVGVGDHEAKIDVIVPASGNPALSAAGSVHHVAWRVAGDEEQKGWQRMLGEAGHYVTPVRDRKYFHSIYFHEPGGVLFEIATDSPGFTVDEKEEELGSHLMLPAWLEPSRERLEQALPHIVVPQRKTQKDWILI